MKVLLAAINAKYIHSNLGIYSLKTYGEKMLKEWGLAEEAKVSLAEYTINHQMEQILQDIYKRKPDVIGFSCYIWNISYVKMILADIKKVLPDVKIWAGGPEVSYHGEAFLKEEPAVDLVMMGEGELTFAHFLKALLEGEDLKQVPGLMVRNADGTFTDTGFRQVMDMSQIPFPYAFMDMKELEHRIIYYESSRGCPFSCSYCLSSIDKKLRFRNLELVKKELQFFLDHKVPQVKFVDRTFNCNPRRTVELLNWIQEHDNGVTNFHFEIAADITTEEELAIMEQMRPGLIQLEIGVQSTNPKTVEAIHRTMDLTKLAEVVSRVKGFGNIHQHLDLIAGLPYENLESFQKSFCSGSIHISACFLHCLHDHLCHITGGLRIQSFIIVPCKSFLKFFHRYFLILIDQFADCKKSICHIGDSKSLRTCKVVNSSTFLDRLAFFQIIIDHMFAVDQTELFQIV